MKRKLLVSVSGGKTSAYMAIKLRELYSDRYDFIYVFANTGEENEQTLDFVNRLNIDLGFPIVWVEAVTHYNQRLGCTHKIVTYETASRKGEPFEAMIKKYGIPNKFYPHCTRELKLNPIWSYMRSIECSDYLTAVGIRSDEISRVRKDAVKARIIYPLVDLLPTDKDDVVDFWATQPFNLELPEYRGNCKTCYKKSFDKLFEIIATTPEQFEFNRRMERENGPRVFFRLNHSTDQLFKLRDAVKQGAPMPKRAVSTCGSECDLHNEIPADIT